MERVVHFEIPTEDAEKSKSFYSNVFGWSYQSFDNEYWIANTGPTEKAGINGAIMKRKDKAQPVVNSIEVTNIDVTIKKIESNGGKIVVPKTPMGEMGWLAYFKDIDENIFGLWEVAKQA